VWCVPFVLNRFAISQHAIDRSPRRRFLLAAGFVAGLALAAVGCAAGRAGSSDPAGDALPTVVEVVDGDTIVVRFGRGRETVRLLGVDTPETKHPTKPAECFGKEASEYTAALLPRGTTVTLARDTEERDAFGRLLAHVFRTDGLFVNHEIVAQGFAATLVISPNTAYSRELREAERRAKAAGLGLWGACGRPDLPIE
jgi:micrococcal nuclease